MRDHFTPDAILERRDDLASCGIILRIRGEAEQHIEHEAHGIPFDLDVALLHDVEKADLHFAGEVGEFVQGEDAAVGPRKHPVVNGKFVAQDVPATRRLDWIQVTNEVRDRHIGSREFLHKSLVAVHPADGRFVT